MEKTQSLNQIYTLYSEWKYLEAKELNDHVLEEDWKNIYAKRYQSLLEKKMKQTLEWERKWPIPKVSWKSLKCPHCVSKIALSWLTQWQKDKIRNKELDNLEIKCPYCHTVFMLQKKTAHSILGIKLWEKISYKQKSYRTVGYIEYSGRWYEWSYSWEVIYLEWILLWDDNSYLYFSEWYSIDDWRKVYEFDFSQKIIPTRPLAVDFSNKTFSVAGTPMQMKKYSTVKVKSAYGENSKSFKIGEQVILAPDTVSWSWCLYEQESSGTQTEVWIYKTDTVSASLARKIFNKTASNTSVNISNWLFNKFLLIWIIWPIFMFLVVIPITNAILEWKDKVDVNHLDIWQKYELEFTNADIKKQKITSTTRYDYGGVKTYFEEKKWIKFSIESEKDKEIIKKIKEMKKNNLWEKSNENTILNFFEWIFYKLK